MADFKSLPEYGKTNLDGLFQRKKTSDFNYRKSVIAFIENNEVPTAQRKIFARNIAKVYVDSAPEAGMSNLVAKTAIKNPGFIADIVAEMYLIEKMSLRSQYRSTPVRARQELFVEQVVKHVRDNGGAKDIFLRPNSMIRMAKLEDALTIIDLDPNNPTAEDDHYERFLFFNQRYERTDNATLKHAALKKYESVCEQYDNSLRLAEKVAKDDAVLGLIDGKETPELNKRILSALKMESYAPTFENHFSALTPDQKRYVARNAINPQVRLSASLSIDDSGLVHQTIKDYLAAVQIVSDETEREVVALIRESGEESLGIALYNAVAFGMRPGLDKALADVQPLPGLERQHAEASLERIRKRLHGEEIPRWIKHNLDEVQSSLGNEFYVMAKQTNELLQWGESNPQMKILCEKKTIEGAAGLQTEKKNMWVDIFRSVDNKTFLTAVLNKNFLEEASKSEEIRYALGERLTDSPIKHEEVKDFNQERHIGLVAGLIKILPSEKICELYPALQDFNKLNLMKILDNATGGDGESFPEPFVGSLVALALEDGISKKPETKMSPKSKDNISEFFLNATQVSYSSLSVDEIQTIRDREKIAATEQTFNALIEQKNYVKERGEIKKAFNEAPPLKINDTWTKEGRRDVINKLSKEPFEIPLIEKEGGLIGYVDLLFDGSKVPTDHELAIALYIDAHKAGSGIDKIIRKLESEKRDINKVVKVLLDADPKQIRGSEHKKSQEHYTLAVSACLQAMMADVVGIDLIIGSVLEKGIEKTPSYLDSGDMRSWVLQDLDVQEIFTFPPVNERVAHKYIEKTVDIKQKNDIATRVVAIDGTTTKGDMDLFSIISSNGVIADIGNVTRRIISKHGGNLTLDHLEKLLHKAPPDSPIRADLLRLAGMKDFSDSMYKREFIEGVIATQSPAYEEKLALLSKIPVTEIQQVTDRHAEAVRKLLDDLHKNPQAQQETTESSLLERAQQQLLQDERLAIEVFSKTHATFSDPNSSGRKDFEFKLKKGLTSEGYIPFIQQLKAKLESTQENIGIKDFEILALKYAPADKVTEVRELFGLEAVDKRNAVVVIMKELEHTELRYNLVLLKKLLTVAFDDEQGKENSIVTLLEKKEKAKVEGHVIELYKLAAMFRRMKQEGVVVVPDSFENVVKELRKKNAEKVGLMAYLDDPIEMVGAIGEQLTEFGGNSLVDEGSRNYLIAEVYSNNSQHYQALIDARVAWDKSYQKPEIDFKGVLFRAILLNIKKENLVDMGLSLNKEKKGEHFLTLFLKELVINTELDEPAKKFIKYYANSTDDIPQGPPKDIVYLIDTLRLLKSKVSEVDLSEKFVQALEETLEVKVNIKEKLLDSVNIEEIQARLNASICNLSTSLLTPDRRSLFTRLVMSDATSESVEINSAREFRRAWLQRYPGAMDEFRAVLLGEMIRGMEIDEVEEITAFKGEIDSFPNEISKFTSRNHHKDLMDILGAKYLNIHKK